MARSRGADPPPRNLDPPARVGEPRRQLPAALFEEASMRRDLMRAVGRAALLAAALSVAAAPLRAEPRVGRPFHWTGALKAGQKLTVHGINGVIHAERASGPEIVVDAEKHGRHDDPDRVEIQ